MTFAARRINLRQACGSPSEKNRREKRTMSLSRGASKCVWTLVCLVSAPLLAAAQTPDAGVAERLSKLEGATAAAQTAGDNAWMLVCAALVLMMTGPGL